jgi:hypothetical protein
MEAQQIDGLIIERLKEAGPMRNAEVPFEAIAREIGWLVKQVQHHVKYFLVGETKIVLRTNLTDYRNRPAVQLFWWDVPTEAEKQMVSDYAAVY